MIRRRLLIVNKSFAVGGIQRSLINMLDEIKEHYEVDLLVFYNEGAFKDKVPKGIRTVKPSMLVSALGMSIADLKKCRNPLKIMFRLFAAGWTKLFSNAFPIRLALMMQKRLKGYDAAIAFHHESRDKTVVSGFSRFIIKCVDAGLKISWIHADSIEAGLNTAQIRNTYSRVDKIVCVSKSAMNSFLQCFPEYSDKSDYCYNFQPYNEIRIKSRESINVLGKNDDELLLFTACRLSEEKGLVRAIRPISALIKEGFSIKWVIAGEGVDRDRILKEIEKFDLQDHIVLLGMVANPYPYMREADLMFISSYHEAAPMVADEAKAVGTPIFSTNIPVIWEKVGREIGFICDNSEEGIYEGLKHILQDPQKVKEWRKALLKQQYANDDSLAFINELLNSPGHVEQDKREVIRQLI